MLKDSYAFSGFSVDNLKTAHKFYTQTLGLHVKEMPMGLSLVLAGRTPVFIYEKPNHVPASFTILNFPVDDIDATIDELIAQGITFERYPDLPAPQDEKGVLRGKKTQDGPDIAWFKDPAGNILAVLSE